MVAVMLYIKHYLYKISVCLLIKDENKYLKEWIDWHNSVGIEHYYIYDNASINPIKDTLLSLYPENMFTFIDWGDKYNHIQIDAYNHCLRHFGSKNQWIAFIDTDEFIHGVLNLDNYIDYPYIRIKWKMFDANGHVNYSNEDVQTRFTKESTWNIGIDYKSIVQPSKVAGMLVHDAVVDGYVPVTIDDAIIHHYYTRSLEEWREKILRGTCSKECRRRYDEFFEINPDLIKYKDERFGLNQQNYQQKNYFYDIRIMAHPSRKEHVSFLLSKLNMPEDIVVYDDRPNGGDAIYTSEKAWRSPITDPKVTHRVVLQDDVLLSDNFLEKLNDIVNTVPDKPISLFNMFIDGLPEYRYKSCCYFVTHEISGVAILMPVEYIQPCWDWINEQKGRDNYCKDDDIMITRYFESCQIAAYTTIPSLVQHMSDNLHESLITHNGERQYFGDRISSTFRQCPKDDFTIFVPPRDKNIRLKLSFIRAKSKKIINKNTIKKFY